MSKLLPLSLFLLLPFFFIISMAADSTSNYTNCPSYSCGTVLISYPFWRMDGNTTPKFCGYEGFGIHCSHSPVDGLERGILNFGGDSYYVKGISYPDRSIILINIDFSDPAANICPRVRHNIQWHTLPFNFSSKTVNLSFHFNCTRIPPFASEIRCLDFGTKKSCVNTADQEPTNFDWGRYTCKEDVVTRVFRWALNPIGNLAKDFGGALSRGFELGWQNMENCSKCEGSAGRCGYNYVKKEFMCFCSDNRTMTDNCNEGEDGHTWKEDTVRRTNLCHYCSKAAIIQRLRGDIQNIRRIILLRILYIRGLKSSKEGKVKFTLFSIWLVTNFSLSFPLLNVQNV